ncbi:hypothetical protein [Leptospira sarikeiensis]|uniref:Uncharacterized protein n=1 Tax=Leptospira sarikeiensis TaxID=2484943 RepID=A0A4V3JSE2_9LEPT|nr:hypothetical protein [Leptospira sarikeiensis]TGL64250.1 hypothetical protein EHQ64_02665 [Leptospira sarikeiensis]
MRKIFLSILLFVNSCSNPIIPGPDIISSYDANEKLLDLLPIKLLLQGDEKTRKMALDIFPRTSGDDVINGCERNVAYFKEDVHRCEILLLLGEPNRSFDEISGEYFRVLLTLCRFKTANAFDVKNFGQGELPIFCF